MPDKLFIEEFEGANGRAEVFEVLGKDELGIETVVYEILFKDQRLEVPTMGEASVLASELAGDSRFTSAH
jgi:hypothetical protein